MSEKRRQRAVSRLEEIPNSHPVELRFRDGSQKTKHIYDVFENNGRVLVQYADGPSSPDVFYGSKVGPGDWLPTVPCHDLGYVKDLDTEQKVSLMSFQNPSDQAA